MNIVDLHDPKRVEGTPDTVEILFSSGNFTQDEFKISKVELRLYVERIDDELGAFSLITSFSQLLRRWFSSRIMIYCFFYSFFH